MKRQPRLLLVGDFATHSGFARVNEAIAAELRPAWDIAILAINYDGDPTPLQRQYRLYPAMNNGDAQGIRRLGELIALERPDAILIVNDPWIVCRHLAAIPEQQAPPIVAYMPVDARSLRPRHVEPLNQLAHAIAYTSFGLAQLRQAGLRIPASIIPHGIDLELFRPVPQAQARRQAGLPLDTYAVLVLDRNQARKRLDIAFDAFARFAAGKPEHVKLIYHGSLLDETRTGWAIEDMAADLGIGDRLVLTSRTLLPGRGVPEAQMRTIYSLADCYLSSSSGEGWGFGGMEAMACGLPCVLPNNAAYADWAAPAAALVDAPIPMRHAGGINTVGCVPRAEALAEWLEWFYQAPAERADYRERGLALVNQERYRWAAIARQFDQVLRAAIETAQAEPLPSDAQALAALAPLLQVAS